MAMQPSIAHVATERRKEAPFAFFFFFVDNFDVVELGEILFRLFPFILLSVFWLSAPEDSIEFSFLENSCPGDEGGESVSSSLNSEPLVLTSWGELSLDGRLVFNT